MGSAATPWAGTGGNLGPLAPAAHDEGVVTDMDVDTGMGEGASDEPVAANDPEFDDDEDEAMMRNSVEAHVKTAATRLSLLRAPCPPNDVQMGSLAARFGHVRTADQERAIADVTADMTAKGHPMDRLVCGDVGFGKTEVAVRAIYLAACAGRQSALLVPSIVVAGLHADALRARLPTEVCIEVLTRNTKLETLLHRVAAGAVSVVVGTSALLSPALTFKNLGLLVVDEEQRFGVAQKEVWKTRAPSIDVLTLTATPIPRTMYMCMRGIRDMSLLTTPPVGRLPILTHVGARDDVLIAQRIRAELARGGQVLYVDHCVNLLAVEAAFLAKAVPECRLAIAHRKTHGHAHRVVRARSRGREAEVEGHLSHGDATEAASRNLLHQPPLVRGRGVLVISCGPLLLVVLVETDGLPATFFPLASGALVVTVVAVTAASHATLAGLPLCPCALDALQRLIKQLRIPSVLGGRQAAHALLRLAEEGALAAQP